MKGIFLTLGVLILIVAVVAMLGALFTLLVGALSGNKKMVKMSSYVLLYSSLGLLVSFTLCSFSG